MALLGISIDGVQNIVCNPSPYQNLTQVYSAKPVLNKATEIDGFQNPLLKIDGFHGTHGTHANEATEFIAGIV